MENKLYDFVVIGGGPAGATISTLLSRKGYEVIVLEKEHFPREHVGESMLAPTYFLFEDLGVLEEMKKRYIRKPGVVFSNASGTDTTNWCFKKVIDDDSWLAFHVERSTFDKLLLDNSQKSGSTVWEGAMVSSVDLDSNPNQVLVKGTRDSSDFVIEGKFLLDASGQQSFLANKLKSKVKNSHLGDRVAIYGHWMDIELDEALQEGNLKIVQLELENGGWMWIIPIGDNKISVGAVIDAEYSKSRRKSLQAEHGRDWYEEVYKEVIQSSSFVSNAMKNAKLINKITITSDYSYKNTNKFGVNYATVGDASSFVDPIFSSGVYLAVKSAYLLADALDEKMKSGQLDPIQKVYNGIEGAYQVVEQLIYNYYSKDAIKFNNMDKYFDVNFEKNRVALQIFHLLISGQFFDAPKKYLDTINLLRDERMLAKYKNLIGYDTKDKNPYPICKK